jgi:NADH:ubiquinone oxidoreductase subunit 2 (subunit N)
MYVSVGSVSFDVISVIVSENCADFNLTFFGVLLFFVAVFFKVGAAPSHF